MWRKREQRKRDRISVRRDRRFTSPASVLSSLTVLACLAAMPAILVLPILRRCGTVIGADIRLSIVGQAILYLLLASMFAGSVVVRGYTKAMLTTRYVSWPWLVVAGSGVAIAMAIFTVQADALMSQIHPGNANSNAQVLAFFVLWLLTVGNAVTGIGNEAADRISLWLEPKIAS